MSHSFKLLTCYSSHPERQRKTFQLHRLYTCFFFKVKSRPRVGLELMTLPGTPDSTLSCRYFYLFSLLTFIYF